MPPSQSASRIPCQVCGRRLVPLKDGTSRNHHPRRYGRGVEQFDRSYCQGSGHRLARWPVGQLLFHHSGDLWQVAEDRGGQWGDYWLKCLHGREKDREMLAHGEYMHRHGWRAPEIVLEVSNAA
jgi:hypothetical protein